MGLQTWAVIMFVGAVVFEGLWELYKFIKRRREKARMKAYREQFYAELLERHRNKPQQKTKAGGEGVPINGVGGCCKKDK